MRRPSSAAPRRATIAATPDRSPRRALLWAPTAVTVAGVLVVGLVYGPREPSAEDPPPVIASVSVVETPPPATSPVALGDTVFEAPAGWTASTSTLPDSGDTVAQLTHRPSGTRVQAATLLERRDPAPACETLAEAFSEQFDDVALDLLLPVAVDGSLGVAARCGFSGNAPDGDRVEVTYTLVQRNLDGHSLLWRTVVPDDAAAGPAVTEANAMACQASRGFGVPLPLC